MVGSPRLDWQIEVNCNLGVYDLPSPMAKPALVPVRREAASTPVVAGTPVFRWTGRVLVVTPR